MPHAPLPKTQVGRPNGVVFAFCNERIVSIVVAWHEVTHPMTVIEVCLVCLLVKPVAAGTGASHTSLLGAPGMMVERGCYKKK